MKPTAKTNTRIMLPKCQDKIDTWVEIVYNQRIKYVELNEPLKSYRTKLVA